MDKYTAASILIIVFFVSLFAWAVGDYNAPLNINVEANTVGNLRTVGVQVYSDENNTILETIDWGNISRGETKNITAYIHNPGNSEAIIHVATGNYTPLSLQAYSSFTCPLNSTVVGAGETVETVLSLHIYLNVTEISEFMFDVVVSASSL